jgi:hypothetical protein
MTQVTFYGYDDQYIFTAPVSFDPYGPCPANSVAEAPPVTTGAEVAQWTGSEWIVLAAYPPIPTPTPPVNDAVYTRLQFLFLFTPEEIIAIQDAAVTNQTIMYYNYMINAVVTLQLTDPAVITGVNMLATEGVITPERAAQILAGDPAP